MAGARIELEYVDEEVTTLINEIIARLDDPSPAFAKVAEYGVKTTRERIETQNADDPIADWEPLTERYLKSKVKREHHPDEILMLHGDLVSTLAWQADARSAAWGSGRAYAAAQQFGRDEINLPGRPFLGVTDKNREAILEIFRRWLLARG